MSAIEDVIRELQELAKARPLKGEAKKKGRQLMSQLRRLGCTNHEIEVLTKKAWTQQQIKQEYTRGASTEDPSVKERAMEVLAEAVSRRLTVDDVEDALALSSDLEDRNVTYDQIGSLLQEITRSNVPAAELVRLHADTKRAGMSISNLAEVRTYKAKLDAQGVTLDRLTLINDAVKIYRDPDQVLKAIAAYGKVGAIDAQIRELSNKKKEGENEQSELNGAIAKLKAEQQRVRGRLDLADRLGAEGFDEPTLRSLAALSAKYGGVAQVTSAVGLYAKVADLEAKVGELSKKRSEAETNLRQAEANWARMASVVMMSESLLFTYKFGPDDVSKVYRAAKLWGDPVGVLNAISEYGKIQTLKAETESLQSKKAALESQLHEAEAELQKTRGLMHEWADDITEALQPLAGDVKAAIEQIKTEFRQASESIGALRTKAEQFDSEVKLARVILALDRFPSEAKDLSGDYALLLLRGVGKILRAKGLNPKSRVPDDLLQKYWVYLSRNTELEALDMISWLEQGLTSALGV